MPRAVTRPHVILALCLGLFAACTSQVTLNAPSGSGVGDTTQTDTTKTDTTQTDTTTVQRATLNVTVVVHGADSVVAAEIGLTTGRLGGAVITARRQTTSSAATDTAGPDGTTSFPQLLPGRYTVTVIRRVSVQEAQGLDSADADVNAFGGGGAVTLGAPNTSVTITAAAGRRGSLVISEVSAPDMSNNRNAPSYQNGGFLELYNNADTTIYLDGKVVGIGEAWHRDYDSPRSCTEMEKWRNDPAGIWTAFFDSIPGSGHEYPLAPGHAAVLATDAIDHSALYPGLPNLSYANFEFIGSADVDNPSVPNMVDIGTQTFGGGISTHGLQFVSGDMVVFVAEPVDTASLVHDNLPVQDPLYARIPRSAILDVFSTAEIPSQEATEPYALCSQLVNDVFDHQYANLYDFDYNIIQGMARKVFTTLPDGRVILLRTRSSANDFTIVAPPTPGNVP